MPRSAKVFDFFGLPRELRDKCYEGMLVPEVRLRSAAELERVKKTAERERVRKAAMNVGLWDPIYDYGSAFGVVEVAESAVPKLPSTVLQVQQAPNPVLLLLNRQFKDEYTSTVHKHAKLLICRLDNATQSDLHLPDVLRGVRVVQIRTSVDCKGLHERIAPSYPCQAKNHIDHMVDCVNTLRHQLPSPRISIDVQVLRALWTLGFIAFDECKQAVAEACTTLTAMPGMKDLVVRAWTDGDDHKVFCEGGPAPIILRLNGDTKKLERVARSAPAVR